MSCRRSIEELSRECGYSADHVRLLFMREYRVSPLAYRRQRRMAQAMELISATGLSVKEIARRLGFHHTPAFTTAFAELFGRSPKEAIRAFRLGAASIELPSEMDGCPPE